LAGGDFFKRSDVDDGWPNLLDQVGEVWQVRTCAWAASSGISKAVADATATNNDTNFLEPTENIIALSRKHEILKFTELAFELQPFKRPLWFTLSELASIGSNQKQR
jgi:hypothetical protein